MEKILFIAAILFLYAADISLLVWLSFRFVALRDIDARSIFSIAISILLFSILSFSALIQVPLPLKPLILLIIVICINGIFIYIVRQKPVKAAIAASFFVFCQLLLTIFLLRHFWNNQFVQQLKYIFIESLY